MQKKYADQCVQMTSEDKAGYEEQGMKVQPLPPPVNSMNSRRNGRPRTLPLIQYQGIIDTLARIETLLDEKTRLNAAEVRSLRPAEQYSCSLDL